MPDKELYGIRRTGGQSGDRSITIPYAVSIAPKDLPEELGVGPLPTIGVTPFVGDPAMIARTFTVDQLGPTASIVNVTYATTRFGGGTLVRSTTDISGNKFVYGADFEFVNFTVPYAVLDRLQINSGDTTDTIRLWVARDNIQISESRMVIRATWEITGLNLGQLRAFNAQNNKIHSFAGGDWLFTMGPVRPIENTTNPSGLYEVNATWTEDLGTPDPGFNSTFDIYFPGGDGLEWIDPTNQPPAGFIRSPYHKLIIAPGEEGEGPLPFIKNKPPRLEQVREYTANPNGYLALGLPPGVIP